MDKNCIFPVFIPFFFLLRKYFAKGLAFKKRIC